MPSIVLVNPEIPQNTGNIARLTAAMSCELHLIEPLGFSLEDRYLKRAGLDYWPETSVYVHADWEGFLENTGCTTEQLWFFSKKAKVPYYSVSYADADYLVFGSETKGLSDELRGEFHDRLVLIPMDNPRVRSLNLSNSAAIALAEARRQLAQ